MKFTELYEMVMFSKDKFNTLFELVTMNPLGFGIQGYKIANCFSGMKELNSTKEVLNCIIDCYYTWLDTYLYYRTLKALPFWKKIKFFLRERKKRKMMKNEERNGE